MKNKTGAALLVDDTRREMPEVADGLHVPSKDALDDFTWGADASEEACEVTDDAGTELEAFTFAGP